MTIQVYELSGVNIVSENFGGEIVAVNLDSGKYYSSLKTGAYVWSALIAHHSTEQIVTVLSNLYQLESGVVSHDILRFVDQLIQEGLITPAQQATPPLPTDEPAGDYAPPVFEIFSDMQEILLLDPVHDVDASGWPLANR